MKVRFLVSNPTPMKIVIWVATSILLCSCAVVIGDPPDNNILYFNVEKFQSKFHGSNVSWSFRGHLKDVTYYFSVNATINHNVYAPNATVWDDATKTTIAPVSRSYRGTFILITFSRLTQTEEREKGDAALTLHPDNRRCEGVLFGSTTTWHLDRVEIHTEFLDKNKHAGVGGKNEMLVWRSNAFQLFGDSTSNLDGKLNGQSTELKDVNKTRIGMKNFRRRLQGGRWVWNGWKWIWVTRRPPSPAPPPPGSGGGGQGYYPFRNCWWSGSKPDVKYVKIGFLVDDGFRQTVRERDIARYVERLVNQATVMYERQLNIGLQVGKVYTSENARELSPYPHFIRQGIGRSSRCMHNRINDANYRWKAGFARSNRVDRDYSVWHLLTSCPYDRTGGVAYLNMLCQRYMNVAVTRYARPGNSMGTWAVMAHEIGHNFGAGHSFERGQGRTGGIMDYGDGRYPLNRGPRQFNPLRRREVCGRLRSAIQDQGYRGGIPARICFNSGSGHHIRQYHWSQVSNSGNCVPACGVTRMRVQSPKCVRLGTLKPVSQELCDITSKPPTATMICAPLPCANATGPRCGNGRWEAGEECEYSLDDKCCNMQCRRVQSCGCVKTNRKVDAVFQNFEDGYTYKFQDQYYTRYDPKDATRAPSTYRGRLISSLQGMHPFFHDGISAAYQELGGNVLLFKGQSIGFYNFEIDSMAAIGNGTSHVYSVWEIFEAPSEFRTICDDIGITSTLRRSAVIWIFCGKYFTKCLAASRQCGSVVSPQSPIFPVSILNLTFHENQADLPISASTMGEDDIFYSGYHSVRRFPLAGLSSSPQLNPEIGAIPIGCPGSIPDKLCSGHCKTCQEAHKGMCQSCHEGYRMQGFRCINNKVLTMLLFNNDTLSLMSDSAALLNGRTQLDLLRRQPAAYQAGVFGQAARLGANLRLDMKPLEHSLENWAIKVYLKPILTPIQDEKFDLLTVREPNGKLLNIQIQIANETSISLLNVVVNFLGKPLVVSTPLQWGTRQSTFDTSQFHLLEIKYMGKIFTTIYDDIRTDISFDTGRSPQISFQRWWLGNENNGAKLYLDTFQLIDLDRAVGQDPRSTSRGTAGNKNDFDKRFVSVGWVIFILVLLGAVVAGLRGCCWFWNYSRLHEGEEEYILMAAYNANNA